MLSRGYVLLSRGPCPNLDAWSLSALKHPDITASRWWHAVCFWLGMTNLVEALSALTLGPRPGRTEITQLIQSTQPERELHELTNTLSAEVWLKARQCSKAICSLGIQTVAPWDLPGALKRLRNPPLGLFVRGAAAALYGDSDAIVGSRSACDGPLWWARQRALAACSKGRAVVSGGACGIDSEAHRATWGTGGVGIVVLGVAVDRSYPSENKNLFGEIVRQGGAIVSEHPPLAKTYALHHATRNRIIAGLSRVLWVAEAGESSGTLHTARTAMRLGIPIGVPPAEVGGKRGGIEWILEQNAKVSVVGPKD